MTARPGHRPGLWDAYRYRWKRGYFLGRAIRRRRQLTCRVDRTSAIRSGDILLFSTMRNEALRLPHFLDYYRALGVGHFLIVDNGSNDGTSELLADQDDVSLWQTTRSYKASRFGADWLTWLQLRHANRHWALTVDADELLVFPHQESDGLARLTAWMDAHGSAAMSAVMDELQ